MMPTFRQQLVKRRTLLGAVTLFCLLWHILLPAMVHVGLVPALFVMPSHCQPTIQTGMLMANKQDNAAAQSMSHDHAMLTHMQHDVMSGSMPDHMMSHMDHRHMSDHQLQPHMAAPAETDRFHTPHAHEVFALAAKIMKHCPLCSHGLEGGILAPLIALVFVLLACWFAIVRCLCHTWTENKYVPRFSFVLPFKHGPPVAL